MRLAWKLFPFLLAFDVVEVHGEFYHLARKAVPMEFTLIASKNHLVAVLHHGLAGRFFLNFFSSSLG
jgi:hypothetical protein